MSLVIEFLAWQGCFQEHHIALRKIGVRSLDIRLPDDLKRVDALIIPGGRARLSETD